MCSVALAGVRHGRRRDDRCEEREPCCVHAPWGIPIPATSPLGVGSPMCSVALAGVRHGRRRDDRCEEREPCAIKNSNCVAKMRWKYCPLFVFLTMTGDISAQNDGGTHDASSGLMVQKCCPEGQVSFFDSSTGNNLVCVPRNPDLGPDYDWTGNFTTFDGDKMVIADKKPNFTATFGVPKCDEFRVLSPERNASENFAVFVDGNFAVESGHYINPGSYCVDRFVDDKENLTITHRGAIICGPAKWLPPAGVASRIDLLTGHVKYPKCCARNQ
ncbi:unnamed protein product, partial [Notodromas monacha]